MPRVAPVQTRAHRGVLRQLFVFQAVCSDDYCQAIFHIRSLVAIRDHLSRDLVRRLCASSAISRLDYYNAVPTGLPKCSLRPLQLVLSVAARLVYKAK